MKVGFCRIIFSFFILLSLFLYAENREYELLRNLGKANSKERILNLCRYQETIYYNPINQEGIDKLFAGLYKISENDKEFKEYVDFYNRIKPMFLQEMHKQESVHKRLNLFRNVLNYYQSTGDYRFTGICYMHIAYDQYFLGSYESSIENLMKADEHFLNAGYSNVALMGKYLHEMSLVFLFFGQYEKVSELMNISIELPPIDENRDIQRYNNLGIAYENLHRLDDAEKAFRTAIEKSVQYRNMIWKALVSRNLSEVYLQKGKYEEALQLCETTLQYLEKSREREQYSKHILKMAKAKLLMKKDIPGAFALISEAEKMFPPAKKDFYYFGEKEQNEEFRRNYYKVKQLYYKVVNNYEKAYHYSDSLNILKRKQDSTYNSLQIHIVEQRLNIQKNLAELENERKEKSIISTRLWGAVIIGVFATIIFALLYYITKIRRDKEKTEHFFREKTMEEKQQKIQKELNSVKQELQNRLNNISQKNIMIEELTSKLNDLKKENLQQSQDEIKLTEEELQGLKILTKEQWENFRDDFETTHPLFIKKLKKNRLLTESEIRLLMLTKLNYSNKEMTEILGISDNAVRVTWHRIRKKLGLSTDTSPEKILKKM